MLPYLEGFLVAIENGMEFYISEWIYNFMLDYNTNVYPSFTLPTLVEPQPEPAVG